MKHSNITKKQRNQVMEVAMTIPLWLVIANMPDIHIQTLPH